MSFTTKCAIAIASLFCATLGGIALAASSPRGPETVRLVEGRTKGMDGAIRYIVDARDAESHALSWKKHAPWMTIVVCPLTDNGDGIYDAALPEVIPNPAACQTF